MDCIMWRAKYFSKFHAQQEFYTSRRLMNRLTTFYNIEKGYNTIVDDDLLKYPGLHFCHEWDGLLIDKRSPEYEACLCFK